MKRLLLSALILAGCGGSTLPDPSIASITPGTAPASDATAVAVQVHGILPTTVDYDTSKIELDPNVALVVGPLVVGTGKWQANGALTGVVPSLLPVGSYDVRVSFADGRTATLPNAFQVTPGSWPDGYTIDPIGRQRSGVPFQITLHASGSNGPTFHGNVILRTNKGTVTPAITDAFTNGTVTQTVTLPAAANGIVITASDAQGHTGASNVFDVTP